jgi:hypothetical protein
MPAMVYSLFRNHARVSIPSFTWPTPSRCTRSMPPGHVPPFMRKHAALVERVPKKRLAAYLNLLLETLSRLKRCGKI